MSEWHINNQSTKPFLIQQAEKQLSIVKPWKNQSFQNTHRNKFGEWQLDIHQYSFTCFIVDPKALEISIFDAVN